MNTLRKVTQNETAVTFTVNGVANASVNAAFDKSQRSLDNITYNVVVGGTAGKVASRMPTATYGSIAQGMVYGYGQLAKDIIAEKDAKQPSIGEAWSNADQTFVGGYLGGFVGSKTTNAASKYFPKASSDSKIAIDALVGSYTSTLYGIGLNKITEEQK